MVCFMKRDILRKQLNGNCKNLQIQYKRKKKSSSISITLKYICAFVINYETTIMVQKVYRGKNHILHGIFT